MQGLKTRSGETPQQQQSAAAATSTSEASKMLEAALQQMDGIISGAATTSTALASGAVQSSATGSGALRATSTTKALPLGAQSFISAKNVLSTANTLALALEQVGVAAPAPDATTAVIISDWLYTHIPRQDADECLRRLQRDKETLALQYQKLAERSAEQADKIIELERLLTERSQQLSAKDELLQRQMLTRSALETQKLELMTALSELKLHRAALERENVELKAVEQTLENGNLVRGAGCGGGSVVTFANVNRLSRRSSYGSLGNLPKGAVSAAGAGTAPKTPPSSLRHQILPQFHSLPRAHSSKNNNSKTTNSNRALDSNAIAKRNVAFASNEKILIEDQVSSGSGGHGGGELMYNSFTSHTNSTPSPNLRERSAKGLRNIFGKLRRSNSGNLELPALEQAEPEFKRGGARATAGGRIEWTTQTSQLSNSSSTKAYADWTPQEVCNWLTDLGLGCYEEECRRWLKANASVCFFTASPVDIEKELGLKMPLHRKKILLAIDEITGKEDDALALKAALLDVSWVMRWLDDIGLPQYKETFLQAKVDGRMLHRLTMEDLTQLHVSSCLHIASLRRGIQCMREMAWHPECLIRRSTNAHAITTTNSPARSLAREQADESDGGDETTAASESTADDEEELAAECIALWTAHRVMEWLRVADLSEYAPNLRGAGVHGALMLYEDRFNANLLADLLSIPPSKTLLRRHIATHFKELLGREVIHAKRDAEAAAGYQPLTITAKLKPPKKSQFSIKRRKSIKGAAAGELEWTGYVCPMDPSSDANLAEQQAQNNSTNSSTSTNTNSNSLQSN